MPDHRLKSSTLTTIVMIIFFLIAAFAIIVGAPMPLPPRNIRNREGESKDNDNSVQNMNEYAVRHTFLEEEKIFKLDNMEPSDGDLLNYFVSLQHLLSKGDVKVALQSLRAYLPNIEKSPKVTSGMLYQVYGQMLRYALLSGDLTEVILAKSALNTASMLAEQYNFQPVLITVTDKNDKMDISPLVDAITSYAYEHVMHYNDRPQQAIIFEIPNNYQLIPLQEKRKATFEDTVVLAPRTKNQGTVYITGTCEAALSSFSSEPTPFVKRVLDELSEKGGSDIIMLVKQIEAAKNTHDCLTALTKISVLERAVVVKNIEMPALSEYLYNVKVEIGQLAAAGASVSVIKPIEDELPTKTGTLYRRLQKEMPEVFVGENFNTRVNNLLVALALQDAGRILESFNMLQDLAEILVPTVDFSEKNGKFAIATLTELISVCWKTRTLECFSYVLDFFEKNRDDVLILGFRQIGLVEAELTVFRDISKKAYKLFLENNGFPAHENASVFTFDITIPEGIAGDASITVKAGIGVLREKFGHRIKQEKQVQHGAMQSIMKTLISPFFKSVVMLVIGILFAVLSMILIAPRKIAKNKNSEALNAKDIVDFVEKTLNENFPFWSHVISINDTLVIATGEIDRIPACLISREKQQLLGKETFTLSRKSIIPVVTGIRDVLWKYIGKSVAVNVFDNLMTVSIKRSLIESKLKNAADLYQAFGADKIEKIKNVIAESSEEYLQFARLQQYITTQQNMLLNWKEIESAHGIELANQEKKVERLSMALGETDLYQSRIAVLNTIQSCKESFSIANDVVSHAVVINQLNIQELTEQELTALEQKYRSLTQSIQAVKTTFKQLKTEIARFEQETEAFTAKIEVERQTLEEEYLKAEQEKQDLRAILDKKIKCTKEQVLCKQSAIDTFLMRTAADIGDFDYIKKQILTSEIALTDNPIVQTFIAKHDELKNQYENIKKSFDFVSTFDESQFRQFNRNIKKINRSIGVIRPLLIDLKRREEECNKLLQDTKRQLVLMQNERSKEEEIQPATNAVPIFQEGIFLYPYKREPKNKVTEYKKRIQSKPTKPKIKVATQQTTPQDPILQKIIFYRTCITTGLAKYAEINYRRENGTKIGSLGLAHIKSLQLYCLRAILYILEYAKKQENLQCPNTKWLRDNVLAHSRLTLQNLPTLGVIFRGIMNIEDTAFLLQLEENISMHRKKFFALSKRYEDQDLKTLKQTMVSELEDLAKFCLCYKESSTNSDMLDRSTFTDAVMTSLLVLGTIMQTFKEHQVKYPGVWTKLQCDKLLHFCMKPRNSFAHELPAASEEAPSSVYFDDFESLLAALHGEIGSSEKLVEFIILNIKSAEECLKALQQTPKEQQQPMPQLQLSTQPQPRISLHDNAYAFGFNAARYSDIYETSMDPVIKSLDP